MTLESGDNRAKSGEDASVADRSSTPDELEVAARTTAVRILYLLLGCLFVGLAFIGSILPGIPATPFLLLACFCFSRSYPKWEAALLRSPLFGPILLDWKKHRGIRTRIRLWALAVIVSMLLLTVCFAGMSAISNATVLVFGAIGIAVVCSLPKLVER